MFIGLESRQFCTGIAICTTGSVFRFAGHKSISSATRVSTGIRVVLKT
ncbi:hypothetical protein RSSM_03487 [Rhodopirellula sallentina SM41]|uniref:Uncharacterized protein n=1 Tax=Rhodopirellula sallentina SM41 TaxID=1263870 RepID=M5UGM3_9BACT|nr:hypothetical protein RSSM_03487 [Rhodopirellula sallentina SM41]